jgi:hypothetical protein
MYTDLLCVALHRGPGDKKQRRLIVGTQTEKDDFIIIAKDDIGMMHICQTTKQASQAFESHERSRTASI